LDKEIISIFEEVDRDKSGFIEKNELKDALIKIGINPTLQEIDKFMSTFDKNKDEKISLDEFKLIFYDKIRSEMMLMDETMSKLRKEFRKADINQTRMLNIEQLKFLFNNSYFYFKTFLLAKFLKI
jgi:Ca2+-binding EF-hand superfamily protein